MATRNKSTKVLKREKVVPFEGEENFVVPKKGGFGQPDMEGYVMVAGSTSKTSTGLTIETSPTYNPNTDAPAPTSGTPSTTLEQPTLTPELPTTSPTPIPYTQGTSGVSTPTTSGTTPPVTSTTATNLPPLTADEMPAPVSNIPTFPSVTNMTCDQLKAHILDLETTMATSRFAANIVDAYNTQLALAKSTYTTKCPLPSTQVNVSVTPPVTPPIGGGLIGGGFGGGGGGGIGEPPADEVPVEEEQKKGINGLWLILGIGAVVYFLTRRSN